MQKQEIDTKQKKTEAHIFVRDNLARQTVGFTEAVTVYRLQQYGNQRNGPDLSFNWRGVGSLVVVLTH